MDTKHDDSRPHTSQRGVTLIETMIVIAVTVIVAATAAPSLARLIDARRLDAAANQLAADIQLVRTEAVARNRPIRLSLHGGVESSCWIVHTGATAQCTCAGNGPAAWRRSPAHRARQRHRPQRPGVLRRPVRACGSATRRARPLGAIPFNAKTLGDGRSAWKPAPGGTVAVVFDDASGSIVLRCTGVTAATGSLTSGDLAACTPGVWLLLSGTIRFTSATPPLAARASDTPLPVVVSLSLSAGTYAVAPECSVDAMKTVRYSVGESLHLDAVPIDAEPASLGVAARDDTGDRYASYRCLVTPRSDGRWSGRTTLVPSGWTIGTGTADRRVCRFSSDLDGSGAIDANIEHAAAYADVDGALTEQNFLVIPGGESCPAESAGGPLTIALATVQQQP